MPYKDPERKRQWEREHREQRNAQRGRRHLDMQSTKVIPKRPDPVSTREAGSGWGILIGIVLAVGLALLGVPAALSRPPAK